jgi:CPA2 family monovalent cation:H+ antiporter-2
VGCGRVGRHIAEALGRLDIPRIVVEDNPARVAKLKELAVPTLFGDASSSEILDHAGLPRARALVITIPDDAAALAVAARAHEVAPELRIVARASSWEGARRLADAGVHDVVRPELEGGIEIVRRTLLDLDLPLSDVQRYADLVRREGLDERERPSAAGTRALDELIAASRNIEIVWADIAETSSFAGKTIGASQLRTRTGASIVGIARDGQILINPGPEALLRTGDRLALIGRPEHVKAADRAIRETAPASDPVERQVTP